jgi:hypothetical protein
VASDSRDKGAQQYCDQVLLLLLHTEDIQIPKIMLR